MNKIILLDKAPRVEIKEDFDFEAHDRWPVELLGLKPNYGHGLYYLLFNRFGVWWFKSTVKKFIRLQTVTKSLASCRSYITGLAHFDAFMRTLEVLPDAEQVNRELIVHYLSYLNSTPLSIVSKRMTLVHFRTFHQTVIEEGWLPWPERQLVYTSDMPKGSVNIPKYIRETVIMQLKQHLHKLPEMI